jgi:hypothetical protein
MVSSAVATIAVTVGSSALLPGELLSGERTLLADEEVGLPSGGVDDVELGPESQGLARGLGVDREAGGGQRAHQRAQAARRRVDHEIDTTSLALLAVIRAGH